MTDRVPAELKDSLRAEAFSRRDALSDAVREAHSAAIARHVLGLPEAAGPVGTYWPMRSEVDTRPILDGLAARGVTLALSEVRHPHLSWREWRPGDALVRGGFGVREPGPDAPEVFPRTLLVPLCAFDRRGGRLGYGKGHFDVSIAALSRLGPVRVIGLAFSVQEIDAVPQEAHDRRLDGVVTESGIRLLGRQAD